MNIISNLLFIDINTVIDYETVSKAVNKNTKVVHYNPSTTGREEMENAFHPSSDQKHRIRRLGFVFATNGHNIFVENKTFQEPEILHWLVGLINRRKIKKVDFFGCSTLIYDDWRKYYDLLTRQTSALIYANSRLTGNLLYGGNWKLEQYGGKTAESVDKKFFNSEIGDYSRVFDISQIRFFLIDNSGIPWCCGDQSQGTGNRTLGTINQTAFEPYLFKPSTPNIVPGNITGFGISTFCNLILCNDKTYFCTSDGNETRRFYSYIGSSSTGNSFVLCDKFPNLIGSFGIKQFLSFASNSQLLLTNDGNIYSFGGFSTGNESKQFGNVNLSGISSTTNGVAYKMDNSTGKIPVQIETINPAGGASSSSASVLVRMSDGSLYGCGINIKLGIGQASGTTNSIIPLMSTGNAFPALISGETIKHISGSSTHALALTNYGNIYYIKGYPGGFSTTQTTTQSDNRWVQANLMAAGNKKPVYVSAGANNTSAVLYPDGTIYGCGTSIMLAVTNGTNYQQCLQLPAGHYASAMQFSASSAMVLASNGNVYATGDNSYGQLGQGDQIQRTTLVQMKANVNNTIVPMTNVRTLAINYTPIVPVPSPTTPTLISANSSYDGTSITVSFTPGLYSTSYTYSSNGVSYYPATVTANTFVVSGLVSTTRYPITMIAINESGSSSATANITPGSAPTIVSVSPANNSATVVIGGSTGGYPSVSSYYYSIDGGLTFGNLINSASTTLTIPSLTVGIDYSVSLIAASSAWTSPKSANFTANSIGVGSSPNINNVVPGANTLSVSISLSTGGSPAPTYYYSVSGNVASSYVLASPQPSVSNSNTFVINISSSANISILARNTAGNVYSANTWIASSYYLGTAPNIISVEPGANLLTVSFASTVGGNPLLTEGNYYYSIDNGTTYSQIQNASITGTTGPNTFIITGTTSYKSYNVRMYSSNPAGNMFSVNSPSQIPYVVGNVAPTIQSITSAANAVVVQFSNVQNSNPLPYYYYSVDGYTFANSGLTSNTSTITITSNMTYGTHSIQLMAVNVAGNIYSANVSGQPYTLGTAPSITNVDPSFNALIVSFNPTVNSYPEVTAGNYYYSINNGSTYLPANLITANTFAITGLTTYQTYPVQMYSYSPAGNLLSPITFFQIPYLQGTAPNITSVSPNANSLTVSFTASINANPPATSADYYYSIDGVHYLAANPTASNTFTISGLYTNKLYTVSMYVYNKIGNVYSVNTPSQRPYSLGSLNVCNVNNANLALYYPLNNDLLNYASGTGTSSYNVNSEVSYNWDAGNTVVGIGAAYFGANNVSGFQPVQTIVLGTNGATAATWIKLTDLTAGLYKYVRIFEFVNSAGAPFFSLQFNNTFSSIIVAFETGVKFSYPFIVDANWHHYCVIVSSTGGFTLYIDNAVIGMNTYGNYAATFSNTINSCYVGGTNTGLGLSIT